jgi:hypothetical protein
MAAGVNYNNVWAGLGIPVDVIGARNKAGEPERFHIGGSDASGIVYKPSARTSPTSRSATRWSCTAASGTARSRPSCGRRPDVFAELPHLGLRDQLRQLRPVHQGAGAPVHAQAPQHLTWEAAAGLHAGGRHRLPHAARLGRARRARKDDVVLIWGGAGGLGSMAIQIVKAAGGIPIAVVSAKDKFDYCMNSAPRAASTATTSTTGACCPTGRTRGYGTVAQGRAQVRQGDLGRAGRARARTSSSSTRRDHHPHLDLRLRHRRHGGHLRRHHRLQRHRRPALPVDAPEASAGLALRQHRAVRSGCCCSTRTRWCVRARCAACSTS